MKTSFESSPSVAARGLTVQRALLAAALAATLTACSTAQDMAGMSYNNLPESPDVEDAPWPRLADGPKPVAPMNLQEPQADLPERRRAAAVTQDLQAESARLRAEAARLNAEKSTGSRVVALTNQRAGDALAAEEASVKAADDNEAELLRKEIEAELNAAFGDDAAAAAAD